MAKPRAGRGLAHARLAGVDLLRTNIENELLAAGPVDPGEPPECPREGEEEEVAAAAHRDVKLAEPRDRLVIEKLGAR